MARPLGIEYPSIIYHITSRGNARPPVFDNDRDRTGFSATLKVWLKDTIGYAIPIALWITIITCLWRRLMETYLWERGTSTGSILKRSIADTSGWVMFFKEDLSQSLWSSKATCWRFADIWRSCCHQGK
jgi:hypothetical protein